MAAALVGGAILSAALQVLFDRAIPKSSFITSCFRKQDSGSKSEEDPIGELRQKLSCSLLNIKQVLDDSDAEDMQVMKPAVIEWLNCLQEVLYDAEDLLEEIDGEAQQGHAKDVIVNPEGYSHVNGDSTSSLHLSPFTPSVPQAPNSQPSDATPSLPSSPHPSSSPRQSTQLFSGCFPTLSSKRDASPSIDSLSSLRSKSKLLKFTRQLPKSSSPPLTHTSPLDNFDSFSASLLPSPTYSVSPSFSLDTRVYQSDPAWLYAPSKEEQEQSLMDKKMHSRKLKLEKMCERLDDLLKHMGDLHLERATKGEPLGRLPSTALPDEEELSGREEELGKILEFVRSAAANSKSISVISITGMPGVGKTSLAQHVYNDATLEEPFDYKAWICVSHDFSVVRLTKMILESVSQQRMDTDNLNYLQLSLSTKLRGMRFLLVLDDVWSENFDSWDTLLKPLKVGSKETVVIVTTRHESISTSSNACLTLHLEKLSDEACYSIIKRHASPDRTQSATEKVEDVGRKISLKCKGLPLAAKAAGHLLRGTTVTKWARILDSDLWNLVNDDVLPALKLSYQYLPSHLKRCFSYCSIFPKDYEYDKKKLILLWIAEGLVQQPHDGKSIEEEGDAYFSELFSRSFFQKSRSNPSCFVMHDLFHVLAQFVSKQFFCRVEHNKVCQISSKIRHLSYQRRNCDNLLKLRPFKSLGQLRTFIAIDTPADYYYVSLRALNDLLPMLRCVRVLSLSRYQIYYLSDAIGELKQLRFLDVSFTMIKYLPERICNLHNLQILLLCHCSQLIKLPAHMQRLTSLRHLDLTGTSLTEMPANMCDLSSLQTLGKFVVDPYNLHKLGELKHLQGDLCISITITIPGQIHASDSYLQHLESLEGLKLEWVSALGDSELEYEVLSVLWPHTNMKRLSIHGYGGTRFPCWISNCEYSNMVSLHLVNCCCLLLPPLGQLPSLKHLLIKGSKEVTTVGPEFYGGDSSCFIPFESLLTLTFEDMPQWKVWVPPGGEGCAFGHLEELCIRDCSILGGQLPQCTPCLEKLVISKCPLLTCPIPLCPPGFESGNRIRNNKVSSLELSSLPQVRQLPSEIHQLTSLTSLDISNCPAIELFPEIQFPPSLKTLRLYECNALLSLPEGMGGIAELAISSCSSLKSFPRSGLPSSLETLKITRCRNLQFMPSQGSHQLPLLTTLEIEESCDSLIHFVLGTIPELYYLKLSKCVNLQSLCVLDSLNHDLHPIHLLYISDCPKLGQVSIPQGRLPTPNLKDLTLSRCRGLKSLPLGMFKDLTSLENLTLDHCPELQPNLQWFNLSSRLRSLSIGDRIFSSVWLSRQLHQFPNLKHLTIEGLEVESFPEIYWVPSRLTSLTISGFQNLKRIDSEGITSLKYLEELIIEDCHRILSVPPEGFPSSLLYLQVTGCPLLKENIMGDGRIRIARVPCVIVDYIVI